MSLVIILGFPDASGKEPTCQCRGCKETQVRSLRWEDPLEEGNGYPLQYSGLENSIDCIVHGVAKRHN